MLQRFDQPRQQTWAHSGPSGASGAFKGCGPINGVEATVQLRREEAIGDGFLETSGHQVPTQRWQAKLTLWLRWHRNWRGKAALGQTIVAVNSCQLFQQIHFQG